MQTFEEVGDNESVVDAVLEGEDGKIAFNARFLMDVLNVIGGEDLLIEINTPSSPGVFKSDRIKGYSHVIMPMYVQW